MRRRLLPLFSLALFVLTVGLGGPAAAQKDNPEKPDDETFALQKLGKLTLMLDAGGHTATIKKVLFTPDGKQLITCGWDHIRVWDVETGQARKVVHLPGAYWAHIPVVSPDGKTLAAVSRAENQNLPSTIYLLSTADWHIQRMFHMPASEKTPKGLSGYGPVLAFSPDGKQLAAGHHLIRIWDLSKESEAPAREFKQGREAQALAFSPPDGRQLLDVSEGIFIRDLATGQRKLFNRDGGVTANARDGFLAWSPDGKTIAHGGNKSGLRLFAPDGTLRANLLKGRQVLSVAFSADSRRVLAVGSHGADIFDVAGAAEAVHFPPARSSINARFAPGALSGDGKLAAVAISNVTYLWNASDGTLVHRLRAPRWLPVQAQATWNADGTAVSWDKLVKGALPTNARPFNFATLQFDPPTGTRHGIVSEQGPLSLNLLKQPRMVQVLKDGKVLSELKTPAPYPMPATSDRVTLVGSERVALATAPELAPTASFLLDAQTGKVVAQMPNFDTMAPSPDGRFLLTISYHHRLLRIWEAREGKLLLTLFLNGQDWVVWTPEGYYAATPDGERLIGWSVDNGMDKLPSYYPAEQFRKQLYRPDVIKLVLEKGGVAEALKAANAARKAKGIEVPTGEARPDKLLPPAVTLAVDASKKPMVTVTVTAKQGCPEQPVKAMRLLVDGRPLPGRLAKVAFDPGKEVPEHQATWTVELPPGRHVLSMLARSKDDTPGFSAECEVESPMPVKDRPVVYLVAIGVNRYRNTALDLKYAQPDAEALAEAFGAACQTGALYHKAIVTPLVNERATRDAVRRALDDVRKAARPNDLFVLAFAGHGVREEGEFFLLTHEADPTDARALAKTALSGAALREGLADFPCQVLLMLDACHAGAFGTGLRPGTDEAARALADVDNRVAVMCAALGHEESLGKDGHGLFTKAVVAALRRDPAAFYNKRTGELTVYHLQAFVYQWVTEASDAKQTPYLKMPLAQPAFVVAQFPR